MKLISPEEERQWNKEFTINLTLEELKLIYLAVGRCSESDVESAWKSISDDKYPLDTCYNLYNNVEAILERTGGMLHE